MGKWRSLPVSLLLLVPALALAHNISDSNASFVEQLNGPAVIPFLYLGAKHMFTGYDHLLFLVGVVFFLAKPRDVVLYVSLFTLGHSITLLLGVLSGWQANAYLVDAVIGLSVVYKAFENMGGFDDLPFRIDSRIAVMTFGLFHGLGLATRLQDLTLTETGLITNLLSFNVGVELGQIAAHCQNEDADEEVGYPMMACHHDRVFHHDVRCPGNGAQADEEKRQRRGIYHYCCTASPGVGSVRDHFRRVARCASFSGLRTM